MEKVARTSADQKLKGQEWAAAHSRPVPVKPVKLPDAPKTPSLTNTASAPSRAAAGQKAQGDTTQPLPADLAQQFGASYGQDFSSVVLRTGPAADAACRVRGTDAFTVGNMVTMSSSAGTPGAPGFSSVIDSQLATIAQKAPGTAGPDRQPVRRTQAPDGAAPKVPVKAPAAGPASQAAPAPPAAAPSPAPAPAATPTTPTTAGASPTTRSAASSPQRGELRGNENPNKFKIPIGKGASIEFVPPNVDGDWAVGVGGVKLSDGIKADDKKWWRKNIPTPFFGLALNLGVEIGMEFSLGQIMLDEAYVKYTKSTDMYSISGKAKTGMDLTVFGSLSAGVSADVWIAEAGVGLKAKPSVTKSHPLSATISAGYSHSSGDIAFSGGLSLATLELELKAAVALFAYYDAIGVSTYSKDWTLWERTLGKLTFGGLDASLNWSRNKGFEPKLIPKPFDVQDIEGNIRNMYPSKK